MAAKNPVTGDDIQTKGANSAAYRDNYERIFAKWEHLCSAQGRAIRLLAADHPKCPYCGTHRG